MAFLELASLGQCCNLLDLPNGNGVQHLPLWAKQWSVSSSVNPWLSGVGFRLEVAISCLELCPTPQIGIRIQICRNLKSNSGSSLFSLKFFCFSLLPKFRGSTPHFVCFERGCSWRRSEAYFQSLRIDFEVTSMGK